MDFIIRFLLFTLTTIFTLSIAKESWAKHNILLMIAFLLMAVIIFIA